MYAGEAGGAHNMQHVAGITEAAKKKPSWKRILSANILAMHGNGYRPMEDAAMNYRGYYISVVGISCQYRYLLRSAAN